MYVCVCLREREREREREKERRSVAEILLCRVSGRRSGSRFIPSTNSCIFGHPDGAFVEHV